MTTVAYVSGTLWSLKWTNCCCGRTGVERVKNGRKEETKQKNQGSTVIYGGYRKLR
ncbi:hypothetical protein HanIR_Chr05g0249481 [Helianthus annuus]|nr:hypothetical protein HanIR_Chr05g0249481 [Helianthus annuus]